MRILVSAVAVAVVAGAGVTTALFAMSGSGVPSARTVVTDALTQTSAMSYSFSLNSTVQVNGRTMSSSVVSGAFGPGHEFGAELAATSYEHRPVTARIRFIGKYVYTWVPPGSGLRTGGKPWNKAPIPPLETGRGQGDDLYGFVSDQPVSAIGLSRVLRHAYVVRDVRLISGPGWVGTQYTFTARLSSESVSGSVYVDRQGRARRLVTITIGEGVATRRNLTFGDFGAHETVTAPPASQTGYTSYPYWGFYF